MYVVHAGQLKLVHVPWTICRDIFSKDQCSTKARKNVEL